MGNDIIREKEKYLGVVMSPEKHINNSFGDTYRMLRKTKIAFHCLNKVMKKLKLE